MKYNSICLMVPTYKRPNNLFTFIDSALRTAEDESRLYFVFCINGKDDLTKEYFSIRYWPYPDHVEFMEENTRQPNLSKYFNMMYDNTRFSDKRTLVTMLGDDMVFMTPGWDAKILKAINEMNGEGVIYCDDNYIAHDKCTVNLFTTRKIVEAQKKPFMCEFFHVEMIDVIWTQVGAYTCTLRYLEDVKIQHNHFTKLPQEQWDDAAKRLSPIQKTVNTSRANRQYGLVYATICASNIIKAGIGKWNML